MKTTHYILFLICLVATLNCEAKREPAWMRELPKPGNDTYIYVRESGEGTTVEIALAQAMVRVFQSTANRLGQPFDAQKVNNDLINGADYKTISKQQSIPVADGMLPTSSTPQGDTCWDNLAQEAKLFSFCFY